MIHSKKNLLSIFLAISLLCGCVSGNRGLSSADSETLGLLALKAGYERSAEQLSLPNFDGTITAAALRDDKLWFVSGQALYTANADGSDAREIFVGVPDNMRFIAFGADDDVYFSDSRNVHVFDKDGEPKAQFALEANTDHLQTIFDLATSPDGDPVALIFDDRGGLSTRALTSADFGDEIDYSLPTGTDIKSMSFYEDALLLTLGDSLSLYAESKMTPVFRWTDIGVIGANSYVIGVTENADIMYLDRLDGNPYAIQSKPASSKKTELTLVVIGEGEWVSRELETAIAMFNASNSRCKLNIVRYETLEQLNVQIIAGNIPDLIELDAVPFENFAAKGLFEDLNPYFENDPEVALVPDVRRALSTGDNLFRVSPGFYLMSLVGSSDFVGTEQGWTFEEMKQYLAAAPEGATVFPAGWARENVLEFLLYQNIDEFIDWESGTALFDTPNFNALLEFANTLSDDPPPYQEEMPLIFEGRQLIMHSGYQILAHFVDRDYWFGGKAIHKGFPGSRKSSGVIFPDAFSLSMTAACANKDDAWNFIRTALLNVRLDRVIPTVQSKFDLAIETAMSEPYKRNDPRPPGQEPHPEIPPMAQEQYEKFMRVLSEIGPVIGSNVAVRAIIEEEAPAYFAGDKTVDEVCAIIQNRAQLYVWEQG